MMRNLTKEDIGKYITFRPLTFWGRPKVERKLTHVVKANGCNCCCVTYNGCRPFYVHHHEIESIRVKKV